MTSSINTTIPATGSALQSAPIRSNFTAAASDINALQISVTTLQSQIANIASNGNYANVLTYFTAGVNIRVACQNAVNAVSALGGGAVDLPAGTYSGWDCSIPLILPSNIYFYGVPGQTRIIPDMATVPPLLPFPLAGGAMIYSGDPVTGNRSGVTSGQTVNSATITSNIHIYGITIDNSSYGGAALPVGSNLLGIAIAFTHRCSVMRCEVYNLPSSGIYLFGCRDYDVMANHVESCGFLVSAPGSRNGISTPGWIDAATQANASQNGKVIGNTSNFNYQEGIQNSTTKGILISKNTLIGNHEYGIEGEGTTPGNTDTSATYGYEVPADTIIEGNYIDGFDIVANYYGASGINWVTGNQGKIAIRGNTIKNMLNSVGDSSAGGIIATQVNNGVVQISDNYLDNITPGTAGAIILAGAASTHIIGNIANGCASTAVMLSVFVPTNLTDLVVENNHVMGNAIKRFSFATIDNGVSNTVNVNQIVFSDNSIVGATNEFIVLNLPHTVNITRLDCTDNTAIGINSGANASAGFLRIEGGAPSYALSITEMDIGNNKATFAGTTANPVMFDASVSTGAVVLGNFSGNKFGATTGNADVNTPSIITNLYRYNNGCPGQRITYGNAAPTSGSWTKGDTVYTSAPSSGKPFAFGCVVTGTPGIWAQVNYA